jgi:5'-methylthioadenosine phosphorylase
VPFQCQTLPVTATADIGVIGGSGLYRLLDDAERIDVTTPWGEPSAPVTVGELAGRSVAFLPRHGEHHQLPPHRIAYRANLWALASLGVRRVLAPCAVGSLRSDLDLGAFVVPDQLVDRTSGRPQTYYEGTGREGRGGVVHAPFADPYCPRLRSALLQAPDATGRRPVDGATMVVVEGPRFSTRAESRWFAGQDWSLVNMTGHPEAVLARELALCYATLAVVTDHDAGIVEGEGVDQVRVFETLAASIARVRELLVAVVADLPADRPECPCRHALDGLALPFDVPGQPLRGSAPDG